MLRSLSLPRRKPCGRHRHPRTEDSFSKVDSNDNSVLHDSSEGGVAGKRADVPADEYPIFVGTTTAKQINTVDLRLIPIACWRVDDVRFDFDSSFVTPDITTELRM